MWETKPRVPVNYVVTVILYEAVHLLLTIMWLPAHFVEISSPFANQLIMW